MKFISLTVGGMLLAGCSSPPPPPPVNWSGSAVEINSGIPDWKENNVVIPSPVITGHWAKAIYDFDGEKGRYLPDDYFAVTHANQIVVLTQTSEGYFNAKHWLRTHGATGVIDYQVKQGCIGCSETDIYFYRIDKLVDIHPIPVKKKTEWMLSAKKTDKDNPSQSQTNKSIINAESVALTNKAKPTDLVSLKSNNNNGILKPPVALQSNSLLSNNVKNGGLLSENKKSLSTAKPVVKPILPLAIKPVPLRQWHANVGLTLHRVLLEWSGEVPCNITGKWTINWNSSKDYSIDSALTFRGEYLDAVTRLFNLYKKANSPLFIDVYQTQCLIIVSDASETKK